MSLLNILADNNSNNGNDNNNNDNNINYFLESSEMLVWFYWHVILPWQC